MRSARLAAALLSTAALVVTSGCNEEALSRSPDAGPPPAGLTPEQASMVLARVGDTTITLADFAAQLERLNRQDRLRYQSKKMRRELLQQMIDVALLAQEARRRGLDETPHVQEAIRQLLRDAMVARAHAGLRAADITPAEVRAYYEANEERFREPERRRVAAIVMKERAAAEEVLAKAKEATDPKAWGELYQAHSVDAPAERDDKDAPELAGDRGLVGPPGDQKGNNANVPDAVRRAVFALKSHGDVAGELVEAEGAFYIVRLSGLAKGHTRSLAEADNAIRAALLQERAREREEKMEAELRERFPVHIDERALSGVTLPAGLDAYRPYWEGDAGAPPGASAAPAGSAPPAGSAGEQAPPAASAPATAPGAP